MLCTKCGTELREGAKFCQSCGKSTGNNPDNSIQPVKDFTNIIGKKYPFTWKSYSLARFPLSLILCSDMTTTLEMDKEQINVFGPDIMFGKEKLLKSISYNNIDSISYKIKPANTAIAWIITIISVLSAFLFFGSGIFDISLFSLFMIIALIYIIPVWSRSVIKPVRLTIIEKNGKKTKLKGEKKCIQIAENAVKDINALINK